MNARVVSPRRTLINALRERLSRFRPHWKLIRQQDAVITTLAEAQLLPDQSKELAMILNALFNAFGMLGSVITGGLMIVFAFAVAGIIIGLACEAFRFYFAGDLYGFSKGFWSGALVSLAWTVYSLSHAATIAGAFYSVLGLLGVALVLLIAVKSYIGMQPRPIPDWA